MTTLHTINGTRISVHTFRNADPLLCLPRPDAYGQAFSAWDIIDPACGTRLLELADHGRCQWFPEETIGQVEELIEMNSFELLPALADCQMKCHPWQSWPETVSKTIVDLLFDLY